MKDDRVIKYINRDIDIGKEIEEMHESWREFFTEKEGMINDIFNKIGTAFYFPERKNVFRFCKDIEKIDDIKIVIVGMDPYYSYSIEGNTIVPTATGRSFEAYGVNLWENRLPKSLENILKAVYKSYKGEDIKKDEIIEKKEKGEFIISEPPDWFKNTEDQGVLWLNAALTVEPGNPGSHFTKWKDFMTELIKHMIEKNNSIIWVLWGDKAQKLVKPILEKNNLNNYIESVHPSARRNNSKGTKSFVEDFDFKNERLPEINWVC